MQLDPLRRRRARTGPQAHSRIRIKIVIVIAENRRFDPGVVRVALVIVNVLCYRFRVCFEYLLGGRINIWIKLGVIIISTTLVEVPL